MKQLTALAATDLDPVRDACRAYDEALAAFSAQMGPAGAALRALLAQSAVGTLGVTDADWQDVCETLKREGVGALVGLILWPPSSMLRAAQVLGTSGSGSSVGAWLAWQSQRGRTVVLLTD